MSRPKIADSDRRTEVLQIRLTKHEKSTLEQAAKQAGSSVTELMRSAALWQCKRINERNEM
jgi:uncharacterized protein (DUF1778 family)